MIWFVNISVIIFMLAAVVIWYMRGDMNGYCKWVEDWWKIAKKYYEKKSS